MKHHALSDPLGLAELSAIIEETTSEARHDLRNKLGAIRNASFYMQRRLSATDAWKADPRLDVMASLVDTEVAGANQLLGTDGERLRKRDPQRTDVRSCVLAAMEHARVSSSTRMQDDLPSATTLADPAEVAVAVRCLIENAAEAMDGIGLVHVRGRIDDRHYWVDVIDRGPGIPESARQTLLAAFYTTKLGRAGLGLNIAQRIAQRYGGKLTLGSSSPTGASVSIALQVAKERSDVDDPAG